ncbi:hypothetical protein CRUP_014230, partial [Coryphaenoides rupestris]
MERRVIWEHNSRLIENNNQQYFMGAKPFSMAMNKYGDLTRQEYHVLQGAMINPHFAKRGKTTSSQKLRQNAKRSKVNLVDCSRPYGTYGCGGAWMANAYDYVISNGLQSTSTQPCFYESSRSVAHIKDYRFIPKGDEQALADAVATIGPITVAIDADHASFMFYSS